MSVSQIHALSHQVQALWALAIPAAVLLPICLIQRYQGLKWHQWVNRLTKVLALTGLGIPLAGSVVDAFSSARLVAEQNVCSSNMTQLARGVVAYAQDWDEHFPPADKWGDFISKRPELAGNSNLFKCPAADSRFGYGFNRALDRIAMEDITAPATVVMLFEMNSDTRNGSGGVAEAIRSGRHSFSANIGYADGHVRHANEHVQSDAVWDERSTGRK